MMADIHMRGKVYRTDFRREYLTEIQAFAEDGTDVLVHRYNHVRNGGMRSIDAAEFRMMRLAASKDTLG